MEIREILSLTRLASSGSILETARRCNLTSGAVHKHLKSLEDEFGVILYEKSAGLLRLTKAGELVLPFLKEMLAQKDAATHALADWKQSTSGVIRIGAGPSFSSHVLPTILSDFQLKYPDVGYYVETGRGDRLTQSLLDGVLDLAFDVGATSLLDPHLNVVASWHAPLGFVTSPAKDHNHCEMKELEALPFILFEPRSRVSELIQAYFDKHNFRPNVVMRSDSAEAIKSMVEGGLGIAMVFLWAAHDELRAARLRRISVIDKPPLVSSLSLIMKKSAYTPKAVEAFVNSVRPMRWDHLIPASPSRLLPS